MPLCIEANPESVYCFMSLFRKDFEHLQLVSKVNFELLFVILYHITALHRDTIIFLWNQVI